MSETMPSIFDAARLVVYRVVGPDPDRTVRNRIHALAQNDPAIRRDFQVVNDEKPMMVRISLPLAVHQADHDAWKHVEYLKERLCEKNLDCHWAWTGSEHNNRSTRITYEIRPIATTNAQLSHRGPGYGDPNLTNGDFRLQAINLALAKNNVKPRRYELYKDSASRLDSVTGHIHLDSPVDVVLLASEGEIGPIPIKYSNYTVEFSYPRGSIAPTSCTTIGMVVRGDGRDEIVHSAELQEHVAKYCRANSKRATVTNIRMSSKHDDYFLCDPCDIITAQGLCELPMPNKRYFRQIFLANANPANYTKTYELLYDREQALIRH